jgi:hypothetical protein
MKRLVLTVFAASMMLAASLAVRPAEAAPVAPNAIQATEAPLIEKAHSERWRAIARSGVPYGYGRGRGYGRGYGGGYGRPRYGRPAYGRHHGYGRRW